MSGPRKNKETRKKTPAVFSIVGGFFLALLAWAVGSAVVSLVSTGDDRSDQFIAEQALADENGPRGTIYDRRYNALAVSVPLCSIYAKPVEVEISDPVLDQLAGLLQQEPEGLRKTLRSERSFVWIGRNMPRSVIDAIEALGIPGIYFEKQMDRYYAEKESAAHVVGFFREGHGLGGIEFHYDRQLRGEQGLKQVRAMDRPLKPVHAVLSIESSLQRLVNDELAAMLSKTGARSAAAMVMDPTNGEVLAMVSQPSFDANRFWEFSDQLLENQLLSKPVYPGDINSLFRLAAVLDSSAGSMADENGKKEYSAVDCWEEKEAGVYAQGGVPAPAMPAVGEESYASLFGLDSKTGIDLSGENAALYQYGYRLGDHFSSTSAVSLLRAFAAVVNGGQLVTPHLLLKTMSEGEDAVVAEGIPAPVRIFPAETAGRLREELGQGAPNFFYAQSAVDMELAAPKRAVSTPASAATGAVAPRTNVTLTQGPEGYQVVLVAAALGDLPRAAMVVVLSGVHAPVSLRDVAESAMKKAITTVAIDRPLPSREDLIVNQGELYRLWQAVHAGKPGSDTAVAAEPVQAIMPDLTGLSLRKALQVLQPYNLEFAIEGNGRVIEQKPQARELITGQNCTIRLRPDERKI